MESTVAYILKHWYQTFEDPLLNITPAAFGEGNGKPLQYSCLENFMDRGAWWATVHGVTKSWTQQSTHPQGRNGYFVSQITDLAYLEKLDLETETKKQLKKIKENKEQFIFLQRNTAQMAQKLLYQVLMKIGVKKEPKIKELDKN